MIIGYARVSTEDQNLDAQINYLKSQNVDLLYQEKISSTKERPQLKKAINSLKNGDTLLVLKLDRLGRSVKDLISLVEAIKLKGAFLKTSDGLDTSNQFGGFVFHIFSALAEMELELIRERTKMGLAIARSKGRIGGRKLGVRLKYDSCKEDLERYYREGKTLVEMAENLNLSMSSIITYLGILRKELAGTSNPLDERQSLKKTNNADIQKIIILRSQGFTYAQIAGAVNRSVCTIKKYCLEYAKSL